MIPIITFSVYLHYMLSSFVNADRNLRISFLPFSNLTNQFLSTIQPSNAMNITKDYIYQFLAGNTAALMNPQKIVDAYWRPYVGYLILVTIGILFIVFFTLVGLCLCCCRCCCKRCGVKPPPQSVKKTKRKRVIFGLLFFLLTSMILIGAIVSMASSFILLEAFKPSNDTSDKDGNLLGNVDSTVSKLIAYSNYLANNLITNGTAIFTDTLDGFISILSGSVNLFIATFEEKVQLKNMINVTDQIIDGYRSLKSEAGNLSNISIIHKEKSPNFESFLNNISQNLTTILNDIACDTTYKDLCDRLKTLLPSLKIGFNYSNINYTADMYAEKIFDNSTDSDLANGRNNVTQKITNIFANINSTFNDYLTNFSKSINISSGILKNLNDSLAWRDTGIKSLNDFINTMKYAKVCNETVYNIFRYAFYGFVALISIVLLVVLLFYVGLLFGIIGKPNFENASYCNKSVGSGFVMGGVAISFMFAWIIMIIVTIMFLFGGLAQTEGCRYITVGSNPVYIQTTDEIIKNIIATKNFTFPLGNVTMTVPKIDFIQSILIRCPQSTDLVSAFQIPVDYFNPISKYFFQTFVKTQLQRVTDQINNYVIPDINIDPIKSNTDRIIKIIDTLQSSYSAATITELNKTVTTVGNFPEFVELIRNLSARSATSYRSFSLNLNSTVTQLSTEVSGMSDLQTSYFQRKMNFNSSINNLDNLLKILNFLLANLQGNISDAKATATAIMSASLDNSTQSQVTKTIVNVIKIVGNCQGLSDTFNSAVGIVCTTFLKPFNNIWMGLGWFLLFIIPAIIIGLKLHGLYRISKVDVESSYINKAYQSSNQVLTTRDMEMSRMDRPRKV